MEQPDDLTRQAFNAVEALAARATVPFIYENTSGAQSVGTGTLFEVDGHNFIVTAKHVAELIAVHELGIPCGQMRCEIWFPGRGLVTKAVKHDAAVFRLDDRESIAALSAGWEFLTLANVSLRAPDNDGPFVLHGYPQALSQYAGGQIRAVSGFIVTSRYHGPTTGFCANEPYDPNADLLLTYRVQGFEPSQGQFTQLPNLAGMSGSSVWAVELPRGTCDRRIWNPRENARIVAVFVSQREEDRSWMRSKKWWLVKRIIDELMSGTH
jgi:hypothetical protein